MNNIGVFSFARKQSQRCPNKMLRPFAGTTLTDIMLEKLAKLGDNTFFAAFEKEFEDKSKMHGVRFVRRDEKSINVDEPIVEILKFLENVEYEYLLIVNGCLPFLRVETIDSFLKDCIRGEYRPAFAVAKRNNFFIDSQHNPLNFDLSLKTINTKTVKPVYEAAHALYFFNKEYFFRNGRYWDWQDVKFIELNDKIELIDIDTEADFRIAEAIYKVNKEVV